MVPKAIESWETASGIFTAPDPGRASETPEAVRHHVSGARGHHQKRPEDPEQEKRKIRKASEDRRERCSGCRSQHLPPTSFGGTGPWKQKDQRVPGPGHRFLSIVRDRSAMPRMYEGCRGGVGEVAMGLFWQAHSWSDESKGPNAEAVRNVPGGILPCSWVFSRGLSCPGVREGGISLAAGLRGPGVLDLPEPL